MNELFDEYNLHQKFKAIIKSKPMKNSITKIATVITLLLCNTFYAQNIITVDNNVNSSANYTSLQTAIDNAQENDFIHLYPSETSYGSCTIKKKLHLRGIGHSPEITNGVGATIASITFDRSTTPATNPTGSSISGLIISGISTIYSSGTPFSFSDIVLENNRIANILTATSCHNWIIRGNVITGYVSIETNNHNWQFVNNFFNSSVFSAVLTNLRNDCVVSNNIFLRSNMSGTSYVIFSNCFNIASNNMFIAQNATVTAIDVTSGGSNVLLSNSLSFNTTGTTLTDLSGTGNYNNTNPSFVLAPTLTSYSVTNDYHSSNATLLGTDGTTIGIYGLNFPFSKRGYSFSMPYIESMTILNPQYLQMEHCKLI
ncbi:hypothetical protein C3L50_07865 [Flavobacterium alvei]|uniref:Right handed beta helix domain-containing protein n=2 Tax=Flavobacterium alvei TaxID=2080416 RepID=A0A2S5ABW2_9FLAO|nr:hypothetical protein C3L50_07865 [Flavobacterium alvei]